MEDTTMGEAPDIPVDELMATELDPAGLMDPMDDLFGDTADGLEMPAPIPAAPLPASLGIHISNMQGVGCTSMLAWSNAGYTAEISRIGCAISFRTVIRHQQSGGSTLSEESKHLVPSPEDAHFAHIQFSGPGTELAAADSLGGVHVYTMTGVLGRLQAAPTRTSLKEGQRTELERVVGLHWLQLWPAEFRAPYITPATKVNGKWLTQMRVLDQHVPQVHHALENRSALLYVTATSKLVLLYQNEQGIWHSTTVQLEDWQYTRDLLTHAAIGEEGDHLILTTHDFNRRFRVFKITIHWNITQRSLSNGTTTTISPTIEIGHLTLLNDVGPQQAQSTKLSSLCVIPAIQQFAEQGLSTATTVVAVFTHAPSRMIDAQQEAFSVLAI
ncbi:Mediator of RNA polymerase II transcription subunit 16 [Friedmanniomyces endolithicus]|nr:Mediator of RNA polymerase II transcription subunit 16 [Friedmanniomyces endolithicus]